MTYMSVGDLAQSFMTRRQNSLLKSDMLRLSQEIASGRTSDLTKKVAGDYTAISGIETSLRTLAAYSTATGEASLFAAGMQSALGLVQGMATEAASALIAINDSSPETTIQAIATDAREKLDGAISALNTQIGSRSLFAGVATDGPALFDTDMLISELEFAVAAETTSAGLEAAVDTWFDTPGSGFDTVAYVGADTPVAAFQIGEGQQTRLEVTAADPALRDTLKGLAIATLVANGALSGDLQARRDLMQASGEILLGSGSALTGLRARVGTVEARIDSVAASNAAETTALEMARLGIVSVDPYRAASELSEVQTQLEALYAMTARMSRLSLVDYLR